LRIDCVATAISAGDNCTVGLFHSPALGDAGTPAFYCPQGRGLAAAGQSQVFFGTAAEPGFVRWFTTVGVQLNSNDAGAPSVNLTADVAHNGIGAQVNGGYLSSNGATFTANLGSGAEVNGGFLAANASNFTANYYGITATGSGLLD